MNNLFMEINKVLKEPVQEPVTELYKQLRNWQVYFLTSLDVTDVDKSQERVFSNFNMGSLFKNMLLMYC